MHHWYAHLTTYLIILHICVVSIVDALPLCNLTTSLLPVELVTLQLQKVVICSCLLSAEELLLVD